MDCVSNGHFRVKLKKVIRVIADNHVLDGKKVSSPTNREQLL